MRHWILGNGASLNRTPLELLAGEITWGMNAIHLLPFKPTHYFCMDVNERDKNWQEAVRANLDCERVFLRSDWGGMFQGNITWLDICKRHHWYAADNYRRRAESWHLPELCTAFGSMNVVMQLAVLNGATEICLVGCDLFDGQADHFSDRYPAFVDWQSRNEIEQYIHAVCKRSSPVPIYNCTIGGMLEAYPRRDFYEVIGEKEEVHRTGA